MSYANKTYGSSAYGGAPAAGDVAITPSVQALTLTHHIPVWVVKHSNPATFALSMSLHAPVLKTSTQVSTQALSLTQQAPTPQISVFPATLALALTLQTANPEVTNVVAASLDLTVDFAVVSGETPVITPDAPALFTLTLTIYAPTPRANRLIDYVAPFQLGLTSPKNPHRTALSIRIVRYIKDPIVTSGCAQCGTFLYEEVRGRNIRADRVSQGRNFDLNGGYREDRWVRCGRCGFLNHPTRNKTEKEGSYVGWGIKYTEIEAGG